MWCLAWLREIREKWLSVHLIQTGLDFDVHLEKGNAAHNLKKCLLGWLLSSKYLSVVENHMEWNSSFCKLLLPVQLKLPSINIYNKILGFKHLVDLFIFHEVFYNFVN